MSIAWSWQFESMVRAIRGAYVLCNQVLLDNMFCFRWKRWLHDFPIKLFLHNMIWKRGLHDFQFKLLWTTWFFNQALLQSNMQPGMFCCKATCPLVCSSDWVCFLIAAVCVHLCRNGVLLQLETFSKQTICNIYYIDAQRGQEKPRHVQWGKKNARRP